MHNTILRYIPGLIDNCRSAKSQSTWHGPESKQLAVRLHAEQNLLCPGKRKNDWGIGVLPSALVQSIPFPMAISSRNRTRTDGRSPAMSARERQTEMTGGTDWGIDWGTDWRND